MRTYKFRLKSKNIATLNRMAGSVNFTWNFFNDTSIQSIEKHNKWLSSYALEKYTSGCSKDLGLHSDTIGVISAEYVSRRNQYRKKKLSWRSKKRSLGWVPFKGRYFKVKEDTIKFYGTTFRFWKSQEIIGQIRCGQFSQDSKGNWYVNITCQQDNKTQIKSGGVVGIDLGLKTIATLSDGIRLERPNITSAYAEKLAKAQRARKKKRITAIHAKIKNTRKDWNQKETTKIINRYDKVFVGNVSSSKLKMTRMAKSVSDAGWADFKSMLAYKAIALGVEYKEVKENFSTVTCSACFERTGPSGLSALGVREWICSVCGTTHDRDVNAAINILRIGSDTPIKGGQKWQASSIKALVFNGL